MRVKDEIEVTLRQALQPQDMAVIDVSDRHAGHAGARPGGETHFEVSIVAAAFAGLPRVERHRMVHAALAELLRTRVHALSLVALSPAEVPAA